MDRAQASAAVKHDPSPRWRTAFLLLALIELVATANFLAGMGLSIDENEFAHVAWAVVQQGRQPHVDFFEHHCPGWWEALGSVYLLGLDDPDVVVRWGRLLFVLSLALQMGAMLRILAPLSGKRWAWAGALCWGAIRVIDVRPEVLSSPLELWALVFFARYLRELDIRSAAVALLLLSAALYVSPRGVFLLAVLAAVVVIRALGVDRRAAHGALPALGLLGPLAVVWRAGLANSVIWIYRFSSSLQPTFSPWPLLIHRGTSPLIALGALSALAALAARIGDAVAHRGQAAAGRDRAPAGLRSAEAVLIAVLACASFVGILLERHPYVHSQVTFRALCVLSLFIALPRLAAARSIRLRTLGIIAAAVTVVLCGRSLKQRIFYDRNDLLPALAARQQVLREIPEGRTLAMFPDELGYSPYVTEATYFWFSTEDTFRSLYSAGVEAPVDFVEQLLANPPYLVSGSARERFAAWARAHDEELGGDMQERLAAWWRDYRPHPELDRSWPSRLGEWTRAYPPFSGLWVHTPNSDGDGEAHPSAGLARR